MIYWMKIIRWTTAPFNNLSNMEWLVTRYVYLETNEGNKRIKMLPVNVSIGRFWSHQVHCERAENVQIAQRIFPTQVEVQLLLQSLFLEYWKPPVMSKWFIGLNAWCMYTHITIGSFYSWSMWTVDLEFPIIQGKDRIGDLCACKLSYFCRSRLVFSH